MKTENPYIPRPSVVEDVQAKMSELLEKKARHLDEATRQLAEARAAVAEAEAAGKTATEQMDYEAFALAEAQQTKAEQKARMFAARIDQIQRDKMVTEEESDRVIDSLRGYLADLDASFDSDLRGILKSLDAMYWAYIEKVRTAENTMSTWTNEIHPNYRSEWSYFIDPNTGLQTHRGQYPIPIQTTNGFGGPSARIVKRFLCNFPSLLAAAHEDGEI